MSWLFLIIAGVLEIIGVVTMKKFALTNKKIYLLGLILQFAFSFGFLSLAMQGISMSVAYAVWTGIGTAGGVMVGVWFFKESKSFWKFFFVGIIIFCSVALKLFA